MPHFQPEQSLSLRSASSSPCQSQEHSSWSLRITDWHNLDSDQKNTTLWPFSGHLACPLPSNVLIVLAGAGGMTSYTASVRVCGKGLRASVYTLYTSLVWIWSWDYMLHNIIFNEARPYVLRMLNMIYTTIYIISSDTPPPFPYHVESVKIWKLLDRFYVEGSTLCKCMGM